MVAAEIVSAADLDWAQTAADFHDFLLTTGKAERTSRSYGFAARMFWRWCYDHETDPLQAPRPALRRWLAERQRSVSAQRVYSDLASLNSFYKFVIDQGARSDNPTDGISIKRPAVLPTEPFTRAELQLLFSSCDNERDRMIVLTLSESGLRIAELASLRGEENFDWRRGRFRFISKGGDERYVPMTPELFARMRAWLGMLPYGPVFCSLKKGKGMSAHQIYKRLVYIGSKVDIEVHPHRFRSTFATEYIEQFHDITALRHIMGHKSVLTTQRYQQTTEARRAEEQMSRLDMGLNRAM
jgi:integrase/recombinase XerD